MLWVMNTQNGSFTTSSPTVWNLIDVYIGKRFISIFRQKEIAWWQSQVLPFKAQPVMKILHFCLIPGVAGHDSFVHYNFLS